MGIASQSQPLSGMAPASGQSDSFPQFKTEEIAGIMKDFDQPGYLALTGLFLGGAKYMVFQGEPGAVIRGKKGTGGITIIRTCQGLVIGIYEQPVTRLGITFLSRGHVATIQ